MRNCLFLFFILLSGYGFAQTPDKRLIQFSGVVINPDSNSVVPYVTVTNVSSRNQVFSANYKGYFSFVVHEGDTLVFSAIGYKREGILVPINLPDNKFTVMMKLKQEAINLPAVQVYPWASTDEFKKQFLTMKFADDDLEIAKKNVSRENLSALSANLPRDGQEMQSYNFQNNHSNLVNKNMNQRMANPLLNPFAWGALIQQIMQGDKSRSKD
ncbi:carboxypeptidase-like regulatory domain-containing protein [Daejeonella oryzae]|uniref:carboxypeptidase-like regulatory domain-containing protein n=1 Tax=Daejeonella oryzae TaxID=1122943 RepID=UPI000422871C|nr:carboxypeptidase-like regulatory domain-containing protein [Daejeonella oryzae]